jgi:peptide/nickel transport system substrate-binding protein
MRNTVYAGFNMPMVGPVPPASGLYNKALADYAHNPALANELLDAAGLKRNASGIRCTFDLLWANYDTACAKMGDIMQRNLAEVGIQVRLQPLERVALNQKGYIALDFDMMVETYGLGPDPDFGVERLYNSHNILLPPAPFTNSAGYANPEVDRLFDQQRAETDPPARKKIYDRIQELIWADVPVLPMFAYAPPNIFRSSYVTGLYEGSYGTLEDYSRAKLV